MEIELTLKNYRCFEDTQPARIVLRDGLTAFIGVNNSGKSSLLRFFYEFRNLFEQLKGQGRILNWLGHTNIFHLTVSNPDQDTAFCEFNNRDLGISLRLASLGAEAVPSGVPIVDEVRFSVLRPSSSPNEYASEGRPDTRRTQPKAYVRNQEIQTQAGTSANGSRILIGTTVVADFELIEQVFPLISNTLYIGAFRNALNTGINAERLAAPEQYAQTWNYFDIDVGRPFIQRWKDFKGGTTQERLRANKVEKTIQGMFNFNELQINPSADGTTLDLMVNGKPRKLYEVGSGITQFVVVLANAAMKRPAYILIDEPELNLHPSLQMRFLKGLNDLATNGTLFATHSIGLARAAATSRIYSVQQDANGRSSVRDLQETDNLSEFLSELSFNSYRELGFDKLPLAEGSTDCETVRQLLCIYGKDHQYVVLSLGGDDQINAKAAKQLEEIKRICLRVVALIDSEKPQQGAPLPANREAFRAACDSTGVTCHVLQRRAIENYFTHRVVHKAFSDKYRALGEFEKLRDVSPAWGKNENWKLAQEMTREELDATDLGKFLSSL
jgi:predicted ATPase